jgi:predicted NUDIX family phosphoesterase
MSGPMMQSQQITHSVAQQTHDEFILVVKRADVFAHHTPWNGLQHEPLKDIMHAIKTKKEFLPRSAMELDPTYKQIIPYLIFTYQDQYFLMQRQAKASEQRLQNKYTLGIGGHIRQEDVTDDSIFEWAKREFHEEVAYSGSLELTTLGVLNDDSNAVGQVHLGLVLLLQGDNSDIQVKSELKSGQLLTLKALAPFYEHMESWSQIVHQALAKEFF